MPDPGAQLHRLTAHRSPPPPPDGACRPAVRRSGVWRARIGTSERLSAWPARQGYPGIGRYTGAHCEHGDHVALNGEQGSIDASAAAVEQLADLFLGVLILWSHRAALRMSSQ